MKPWSAKENLGFILEGLQDRVVACFYGWCPCDYDDFDSSESLLQHAINAENLVKLALLEFRLAYPNIDRFFDLKDCVTSKHRKYLISKLRAVLHDPK
jgi:hypothetical protein